MSRHSSLLPQDRPLSLEFDDLKKGMPELHFLRYAAYKDPMKHDDARGVSFTSTPPDRSSAARKYATLQQMAILDMNGGKIPGVKKEGEDSDQPGVPASSLADQSNNLNSSNSSGSDNNSNSSNASNSSSQNPSGSTTAGVGTSDNSANAGVGSGAPNPHPIRFRSPNPNSSATSPRRFALADKCGWHARWWSRRHQHQHEQSVHGRARCAQADWARRWSGSRRIPYRSRQQCG